MREKTFPVEGMSCAACAKAVERSLKKQEGMLEASVNIATNKVNIKYDDSIFNLEIAKKSLEKLGYDLIEEVEKVEDVHQKKKEDEIVDMKKRFILAIVFAIPLLYLAMAPMIGLKIPQFFMSEHHGLNGKIYSLVQLLLLLPILYAGRSFYTNGFKTLINKSPNMDSLVAIGTSAAILYSLFGTIEIFLGLEHGIHSLYYESAGVIIALILMGKYLETRAKGKTSEAIKKLMKLQPSTARVKRGDLLEEVSIELLNKDDLIILRPGEAVPVDGLVVEGSTFIDESMLTGESIPVEKIVGSKVSAGTVNSNGSIVVKATGLGNETALSKIIELVEKAQGSKAPIGKLADEISGYFVPVVIVISLLSGLLWYFGTKDITFSLKVFISVLVIACPCSLGLATPTALMIGMGKGAQNGILIKDSEALETSHKIKNVVLDKTGTITEGKPRITDLIVNEISKDKLLSIVASGEKYSEHPIGQAIFNEAISKAIKLDDVKEFQSIAGKGISYYIEEKRILVGNKKLMDMNDIINYDENTFNELGKKARTPIYVAIDGKYVGIIGVADPIKETSKKAIEELKEMGISVYMITGDNHETAKAIANEAGIQNVFSQVLPSEKALHVENLMKEGHITAMVGDGINDAPALAQSNVGIAIGSGTDVAIESAQIVLVKDDLLDVVKAIKLSRATIKNVKQNLTWAFLYNILGIPIAAGLLHLFGGPLLNPMIAGGAMALSSVSVVTNALRLRNIKL